MYQNNKEHKVRIKSDTQRCRKCYGRIERKERTKPPPKRTNGSFYYAWWFECMQCKTQYFMEEARVLLEQKPEHRDLYDVTSASAFTRPSFQAEGKVEMVDRKQCTCVNDPDCPFCSAEVTNA